MRFTLIMFLSCIFLLMACKEKKQKSVAVNKDATVVVPPYDPSKDSSVYTGEMKRYWLVLLKKGKNRNQDSASVAKIQAGHIANINRLAKEGKIIMAGPMGTDGDLRGIFIMNCKDSAEVEQFVRTDTAVITGRLKMEYYPWWSERGKFVFK